MRPECAELCELLELGPEVAEALERAGPPPDRAEALTAALCRRETAAEAYRELERLLAPDPDGMRMLRCQLNGVLMAREAYRETGIPDAVFADTVGCFRRFLGESRRVYGRLQFDRGWWTWRQLSLSLFRLGSLEYERRERDGGRVTAVHIPSGADLSPEAVDRSLRQAEDFFDRFFGGMGEIRCHSWLLSPALTPLLREDSNILAFQRRFTVEREDPGDREFIRWLFEMPEETPPERLPERTGLQRAVKKLLLSGGTAGSAYGTMRIDLRRSL